MYFQIGSKTIKTLILVFPILFIASMYWLRINYLPIYLEIAIEDYIIEYLQFFFFLSGGILALLIAFNFHKKLKFLFLTFLVTSLVLIFIAGEEISWGERLFIMQAPAIFDGQTQIPLLQYNVQAEMNLHNFKPIDNIIGKLYLIVGIYFVFPWIFINILNWFNKIKAKKYLPYIISPPILTFYFVPTIINLLNRETLEIREQDYEMAEFLFVLGILIFLILCYTEIRKNNKEAMHL